MRILFVNNDGGGFADHVDIPQGTTVQELFERQMRQAKPENYLIRVNRQAASRDQVLVEGDRVTFTPTKIEGCTSGSPHSASGRLKHCAIVEIDNSIRAVRAGCWTNRFSSLFFCYYSRSKFFLTAPRRCKVLTRHAISVVLHERSSPACV